MMLVVDDHAELRYAVMRMLRHVGYDAVEVSGGQEALDYLRDFKPELIILDCNMPCVDGIAVLRAVRADARLADVPVVVFSADRPGERAREFETLGIQGWIVKASMDFDQIHHFAKLYARPSEPPGRSDRS